MAIDHRRWVRQGEAFWRAHHEPWKRSDLNQREYCELHGIPRKGFENWRAKFKAEPQPPERKLLYRRGSLSHRLSHGLSHSLGHMTNAPVLRPIVPPVRDGRRRAFSDDDKRRIIDKAQRLGASLSAVARSYSIASRIVFRWKHAPSSFVEVQITNPPAGLHEGHASRGIR